ncbi:MAG: PAS domain S-box protein [Betaproteobacteria bacterium]|nr:PAS domain S-box protein [Betaproteobacteria bacterium]
MSPMDPPSQVRPRPLATVVLPLFVLLFALGAVLLGWHELENYHDAVERERLDRKAGDFTLKVSERMLAYQEVLWGAAGLFAASQDVSREDWQHYTEQLGIDQRYPGILAMGYAIRLRSGEIGRHEMRVRREGVRDYRHWPEGVREDYTAIEYIEPLTEMNRRVLGYDMYSEPARREAMERARDEADAALSRRVDLLQQTLDDGTTRRTPGFLLYVPVYEGGRIPAGRDERRRLLQGYVYMAYYATDFFAALVGPDLAGVGLRIYDGHTRNDEHLLFASSPGPGVQASAPVPLMTTRSVGVGGRTLTIQVFPGRNALVTEEADWIVLGLGIGASVLLALLVLLSTQTRRRAELLAREKTAEREAHQGLLNAVFQTVPVVVSLKDDSHRIVAINSEAERFHGKPASYFLGKTDFDLYPADQAERIRAQDLAVIETGESPATEERFVSADGTEKWVLRQKRLSRLPDGGVGVLTSLVDVTERRQAEAASRENEQRWSSVVESASDAIIVIDSTGTIQSINRAGCAMFGYEVDALVGQNVRCLMPAVHGDRHDQYIADYLRTGRTHVIGARRELSARRRDGSYFPIELTVSAFSLGDRRMFTGLVRDLSELQRQQNLTYQIGELARVGGWELDFTTQHIYWTEQTYRIHDVTPETYVPNVETAIAFFVPEHRPVVRDAVEAGMRSGRPWDFVLQLVTAAGRTIWVHVVGKVHVEDGRAVRAYGAIQDVTESRNIEAELRDHRDHLRELVSARTRELEAALETAETANRANSEFLANMSHELRTPMHAILSFASLGASRSQSPDTPPERLNGYFARIDQSGRRLLRLLDDLLDLSKLEAGRMQYDFAEQDLCAVAAGVMAEMEQIARDRSIRLVLHPPTTRCMAWFDRHRIEQVIRNLLSNALKFTPAGRQVSLDTQLATMPTRSCCDDEHDVPAVTIRVTDEGIGIPDGELELVFDKFIQSSTTRSGAGGTGLGLPICREIARAHCGEIHAEHAGGGGTTFVLTIPTHPCPRHGAGIDPTVTAARRLTG